MPIYSIPPEVHGDHHHGNLHSPIGIGPRGNSVFFCNSYVDNGNDTYTAPKSSFVSTRNSGMYDPRTGDLVLFRVEHDDDSSLLIGYIFSINPIGGAITFVKLAEISMSGMSAADRAKLDGIATAANRVTATEVAHYPGATSIRLSIINANDLVASNYYVPKADSDGQIEQDAIADGSIGESKIDPSYRSSIVTQNDLNEAGAIYPFFRSASAEVAQVLLTMGITAPVIKPDQIILSTPILQDARFRLIWLDGTTLDSGDVFYAADLQTSDITLFAKGLHSTATGVQGIDDSWTITPLPTDGDEVSY